MLPSAIGYAPIELSPGHHIIPLEASHEDDAFVEILGIPLAARRQIFLLISPPDRPGLHLSHYEAIHDEFPYDAIEFGLDDFALAYLAAELRIAVVSLDKHLLFAVHKYLNYESWSPCDLHFVPSESLVLLDTNILFGYTEASRPTRRAIVDMLTGQRGITFLAAQHIIAEGRRVCIKRQQAVEVGLKGTYHGLPPEVAQFIDDWDRFESRRTERKHKANLIMASARRNWAQDRRFRNS